MAKAKEMLELIALPESLLIKTLSKGIKEKLQLVITMSRNASLYIFDEPIAGFDPAARDFILRTIMRNYSENASILLATHLIDDVEQLLTRAIFLKSGKVIHDSGADELRESCGASINAIFKEEFKC